MSANAKPDDGHLDQLALDALRAGEGTPESAPTPAAARGAAPPSPALRQAGVAAQGRAAAAPRRAARHRGAHLPRLPGVARERPPAPFPTLLRRWSLPAAGLAAAAALAALAAAGAARRGTSRVAARAVTGGLAPATPRRSRRRNPPCPWTSWTPSGWPGRSGTGGRSPRAGTPTVTGRSTAPTSRRWPARRWRCEDGDGSGSWLCPFPPWQRGIKGVSGLIALALLALLAFIPPPAAAETRFRTYALLVDSAGEPLAAWQVELAYDPADGEDRRGGRRAAPRGRRRRTTTRWAWRRGRLVIAAFTLAPQPPAGATRVARIHVQESGRGEISIRAKLTAAADADGRRIGATVRLVPEEGERP